jgi:WD40 repeat protein
VAATAAGAALILLVASVFLWRNSESASAKAEEQARIAAIQRNAAEEQAGRAEEQTRVAESRRLAAESTSSLAKYPQRSLLLAVVAANVGRERVAASNQSLREALAHVGGNLLGAAAGPINAVAISPDNRWVVTGSDDKTAQLWDLSGKDPAANPVVLRGHEDRVRAVAISPDNRWVVTGSDDRTARLWDLRAKDPAANPVVLRGHEDAVTDKDAVTAVAISPDNRWLVTVSWDNTARLWDLSAKDPAANPVVLRGHGSWVTENTIRAVAISQDNR